MTDKTGKLRVAIIGTSHVHVDLLSHDFSAFPDEAEIVGCAEIGGVSEEEKALRIKYNFPKDLKLKVWDDYRELLSSGIDLALLCTDIASHADIACEILRMGINVMVEKPMALSMADAKRMYRAYKESGAELFINWPVAYLPAFLKVKELADSGIVGDVLRVCYRSPSTPGPYTVTDENREELSKLWWYRKESGGGSISDYAGYGCLLSTWITGKTAVRASGFARQMLLGFSDVEDYSVFTIDFGDSFGLVEGSWSTYSNGEIPTGPVVYGTSGVIVADRYNRNVKVYKTLLPYKPSPKPEYVFDAGEKCDSFAREAIGHLKYGKPLCELLTPELNMRVMAAFDAGIRSCRSGNTEKAEDPFGL